MLPSPPTSRIPLAALLVAALVLPVVIGLDGARAHSHEAARAAPGEELAPAAATAPVEIELATPTTTTTTMAPAPSTTVAPPTTVAPTTTTQPPATTTPPPTTPPTTQAPPTTQPAPQPGTASDRDTACEADLIAWTNQTRAEHGLAALGTDEAIRDVAVDWSRTMAERSELQHNPSFGDQIFRRRPEARIAGENVGRSSRTAGAVYEEFLRSDGHRARILSTDYGAVATGCIRTADGLWVTMNFWG